MSELSEERLRAAKELAGKVLSGHVFAAQHEVYTAVKTLALGLTVALCEREYVPSGLRAIGECEECGHQIVTPLKPLPVAWRYRFLDGPWKYVDREKECNPREGYQREPLFSSPSISPHSENP